MRTLCALLLALAMLSTACGSSTSTTETSSTGNDGAASSQDDGPTSFEDLEYRSPIAEFLGADFTSSENSQAEFDEMQREAERVTAQCMAELGFEYFPRGDSSIMVFNEDTEELPYFSPAWVEKFGFGVTTQWFPQSMVGSDLLGFPDEGFSGPEQDMEEDPNTQYMMSLSEGEREAYQEALYGLPPDFGPEGPDEDFAFEPSGCQFAGFEEASGQGPGGGIEFYRTFSDELDALQDRIEADPRVQQFKREIAACASAAGRNWVDEQDFRDQMERAMRDIGPDFDSDPFAEAGLDPETMTEREINEFFSQINLLGPEDAARLGQLQAEEIALAKVVVGCGGGPLNREALMGEVRVEYEQEFIDNNAAALEPFKADG